MPTQRQFMYSLAIAVLMAAFPAFAQTSTPTFDIDLSGFWSMFVNMFNALAPIVLPIVAIPVAISFLTWIGNQLKNIF